MFRKLNKPQLTKIKQHNFISIRAFDSRLYLDISRSFKWKKSFTYRIIHGHFQNNRLLNYCKIITISRPILARANMGLDFVSGQYGCLFSRCRKSVPNVHLWSVWFVKLQLVRWLFCIVRILIRSEHKYCQIWNTCIVSCIYWSIAFFKQIVDIFF
jgi:hypothetical protein